MICLQEKQAKFSGNPFLSPTTYLSNPTIIHVQVLVEFQALEVVQSVSLGIIAWIKCWICDLKGE